MALLEELYKLPLKDATRKIQWENIQLPTEDLFKFLLDRVKEVPSGDKTGAGDYYYFELFRTLPQELQSQFPYNEMKRIRGGDDHLGLARTLAFELQVLEDHKYYPMQILWKLEDTDHPLTPNGKALALKILKEHIYDGQIKITDRWGNHANLVQRLVRMANGGQIPFEDVKDIFENYAPEQLENKILFENQQIPEKTNWLPLSKHLYKLRKLIKSTPEGKITVKELNQSPMGKRLVQALKPFIAFTQGKPITLDMIDSFESTGEQYDVAKTLWTGRNYQRSRYPVGEGPHQFVLHVKLNDRLRKQLEDAGAMAVFRANEKYWSKGGEPSVLDQIGWARLELDPENKVILVDEVQSFQRQISKMLKVKGRQPGDVGIYRDIEENFSGDKEEFNKYINDRNEKIYSILKDFPNIMLKAINDFANRNGYNKIYWHEYESGVNLKLKKPLDRIDEEDRPPRIMYEDFPKENYFDDSEDAPFGLDGKFFSREARRNYRIAQLLLKAR